MLLRPRLALSRGTNEPAFVQFAHADKRTQCRSASSNASHAGLATTRSTAPVPAVRVKARGLCTSSDDESPPPETPLAAPAVLPPLEPVDDTVLDTPHLPDDPPHLPEAQQEEPAFFPARGTRYNTAPVTRCPPCFSLFPLMTQLVWFQDAGAGAVAEARRQGAAAGAGAGAGAGTAPPRRLPRDARTHRAPCSTRLTRQRR